MGVPGSNLGDGWHNGNSAGNKSYVSYRMGVGTAGYTGYIPSEECLMVPIKAGPSERATLASMVAGLKGNGGGVVAKELSTHRIDFSLTQSQFREATTPNEFWDPNGKQAVGDPPFIRRPETNQAQAFLGESTYRQSFSGSHERYMPQNITALGMVRPPTALNATASLVDTSQPSNPFYVTEYNSTSNQVHGRRPLRFGGRRPGGLPAPAEHRPATVGAEPVHLRTERQSTSYRSDFGEFGSNPAVDRMPAEISDFAKMSTTAELMLGTTKGTCHPPGYTGFIPATKRNPTAMQQATFKVPRDNIGRELSELFQYPIQVPGYSGYRPISSINDVGRDYNPQLTTAGRFFAQGTSNFEPGDLGLSLSCLATKKPQPSLFGMKSKILDELFSQEAAGGNLSDNGRFEAQCYYGKTRPYEGRSVSIIKQPPQWASAN